MIFKKKRIFNYVSKFTKWIKLLYRKILIIKRKLYQIPINLNTIEKFFKKKFKNKNEAEKFIKLKN